MSALPPKPALGAQRPAPEGRQLAFVRLFNPGPEAEAFVLVEPVLLGFDTHFLDGRVHPCTMPLGTCLPCRQGYVPRFRGFVGAMRVKSAGRYIVQVTPAVWRDNADLRRLDGQLTGRRFWIKRLTAAPQATVQWQYEARTPEAVKCGPIDTIGILSRIWGIDLRAVQNAGGFDGDLRPMMQPFPITERKRR